MKTIRLIVDFIYDDELMCGNEEWFLNLIATEQLKVHSSEVGDFIGEMQVLAFHVGEVEHFDEDELYDGNER